MRYSTEKTSERACAMLHGPVYVRLGRKSLKLLEVPIVTLGVGMGSSDRQGERRGLPECS